MNISEIEYSHYHNKTLDGPVDGPLPLPTPKALQVMAVVIHMVVFVVGVPGNLLVLWVTSSRVRRSINAIWFLNLAVADLLSCLALPIIIAIIMHDNWLLGKMACRILPSIFYFNLYASVLLLATISADRFLLVFQPVWCQNYRVTRLAWLVSGVVWTMALILTIPYFMLGRFLEDSVSKKVFCFVRSWQSSRPQVEVAVTITLFVLTFLLPLVTMSVCYTLLLLRTWHRKATRSTKTLKVVVAMVTSFFVLWLPYQVFRMVFFLSPKFSTSWKFFLSLRVVWVSLASVNCCINPVIYVTASRVLHIQVFKFLPGRLRQLLTED